MKNFALINSIPTKSDLPILLNEQNLFFVSQNTLYNPNHVLNFQTKILSCSVSSYIFVQTFDHIYQINNKILSKLKIKKKIELLKTNNEFIFIFYTNVLDIFYVPYEYHRLMYNLKTRIILDSVVKCASVFDSYILIGDEDNKVYVIDFENSNKYILGSFIDEIIDVYINKVEDIVEVKVVTANCVYLYEINKSNAAEQVVCENDTANEEQKIVANKKKHKRYFEQEENENTQTERSKTKLQVKNNYTKSIAEHDNKKNVQCTETENMVICFTLCKKIQLKGIRASCIYKNILFVAHKNTENDRYNISQIDGNKEINTDIENNYDEIYSMSVHEHRIAIKFESIIKTYNIKTSTMLQKYIVDDISTFAYYKNYYFTADLRGLRVFNDKLSLAKEYKFIKQDYKNTKLKSNNKETKLKNETKENIDNNETKEIEVVDSERKHYRSITKINSCFAKNNILLTISTLSTIKLYNYNNFYCYKSFQVPHTIVTAETNDDISLLFIANEQIYIYDTKRGKCIDELSYHKGVVIKMKCFDHFLYSLGVDNLFIKQDIYDTKKAHVIAENESNKTILDFCIQKHVYLLKNQEVTILDKDLNLAKIISLKDDKKVTYEKICVMNDVLVFCYSGYKERISDKDANVLVIENRAKQYNKNTKRYCHTKDYIYDKPNTQPNISQGRKDAYYTEKYFVNIFSIEHGIKLQELAVPEAIQTIQIEDNKLIIKNDNGVNIYAQKTYNFAPVELEVEATVDKVNEFMESKQYLYALVCAIKLNIQETVYDVLQNIDASEIKIIVQNFPSKYVPQLREFLNETVNEKWLKYVVLYHTKNGCKMNVSNLKKISAFAKMNSYMLEAIKKRSVATKK
ncbi:U3 snoRNP protein [Binucleata daphniae]